MFRPQNYGGVFKCRLLVSCGNLDGNVLDQKFDVGCGKFEFEGHGESIMTFPLICRKSGMKKGDGAFSTTQFVSRDFTYAYSCVAALNKLNICFAGNPNQPLDSSQK